MGDDAMQHDSYVQLLLHTVGDFWLQSSWMALNKYRSKRIAAVHAIVYTVPFLILTRNPVQLFLIAIAHGIIDHFRLASVMPRFTNWDWTGWQWHGWRNGRSYNPAAQPPYFGSELSWITTVLDASMHLIWNYLVLKFA